MPAYVSRFERQFPGKTALHDYMKKPDFKDFIKSLHPYAITPYRGGVCTKVRDTTKTGNRRMITAKTEEELIIKLLEWYHGADLENYTVNDFYEKWIVGIRAIGTDDNTVLRDE